MRIPMLRRQQVVLQHRDTCEPGTSTSESSVLRSRGLKWHYFEPQRGSTSQPGVAERMPRTKLYEKTNPGRASTNSSVEHRVGFMDENDAQPACAARPRAVLLNAVGVAQFGRGRPEIAQQNSRVRLRPEILGLLLALAVLTIGNDSIAADPVVTGLDVMQRDGFKVLAGQRVGLITNHTGCNVDGVSAVDLLHRSDAVNLTALFSPEHGFEGKLDISKIDDANDSQTGLRIFSLYGKTRKPTAEMLGTVDTLVFDIQDIGCRFYTYISTMGEAMHAAAEQGKRFVVLDRPNPINGIDIAGPMLDAGAESFVGFHSLPVRHAMTIGELAQMFKAELKLDLQLTVVPCEGWQRSKYWDSTGLTWINPSPNMRCLTQALIYPGVGLMETTNVSVGRGTDTPFEVLGAPWINGRQLAADLNSQQIPGVTFVPIRFVPESSKFKGETCGGINIVMTDRSRFEPLRTGLSIATTVRRLFRSDWQTKGYRRLLGNQQTLQAVEQGDSANRVLSVAEHGVEQFRKRRQRFLLYKSPDE